MKKRFFEVLIFLALSLECTGMNPAPGLRPEKTYEIDFHKEVDRYFPISAYNPKIKDILDLILDFSMTLVLLKNTIPTDKKDYNHDFIGLSLTPNFRIIDLKYFLARELKIPVQKFSMYCAEGKSVETNPLVLVTDKISSEKQLVIKSGPPVKPIPYRACPHCLHKVASPSGHKTFVLPNRFKHSSDCSNRAALKENA